MTKLPTINIKGKEYVLVKDRILAFNEHFPGGSIRTEIVSESDREITVKAVVVPDTTQPERYFTGYSSAVRSGNIPPLENAETSAVGRALAMMGIGVLESVASADEMNKAQNTQTPKIQKTAGKESPHSASKEQIQEILKSGDYDLATGTTKSGKNIGKSWYAIDTQGQRWFIKEETYNYINDLQTKKQVQEAEKIMSPIGKANQKHYQNI